MPGLAASTASRVDSSSKHIVACRVGEHYMLEWCKAQDQNKRRELHVNKHKYCIFKNELVLNVTRSLYPLQSIAQYNETKAYPSVVTTLADMDDASKAWLTELYAKRTATEHFDFWNSTDALLAAGNNNSDAWRRLMNNKEKTYKDLSQIFEFLTPEQLTETKKTIQNMPHFVAQGYALGTAWASQQTGDTVASVLIGGMQTVQNGAFACSAGDVLQWYFDFEEAQFAHKTQKLDNAVHASVVVQAGQRAIFNDDNLEHGDQITSSDVSYENEVHKRRRFGEREHGLPTDGSLAAMKSGTYSKSSGNQDKWKSTGCGKAFPKPYRLALYHVHAGGNIKHTDHYGDRIRIFAKCISSARPHEMVDIMLLTQSL